MGESRRHDSLSDDALAIWKAGVDAVNAERLARSVVTFDAATLSVCGITLPIDAIRRLVVVGAGKAGAGMASGFEQAVGSQILRDRVSGWVNVPDDCVRTLRKIHLHGARPAGVNEPTAAGVVGSEQILRIVSELTDDDVCVVLLSGGGSALLPAPAEGISLEDKQRVTKLLMQAGARIDEMNCVRKHLSQIKGGRLARACGAGRIIALIISDVIGDRLDVIASGPTVDDPTTNEDALAVLQKYSPRLKEMPADVISFLNRAGDSESLPGQQTPFPTAAVSNHVIGNINVALAAAESEARRRGYQVHSFGGSNAGIAREVGVELAERCLKERASAASPVCLLSGGEPVVEMAVTDRPRSGGRNQELVLAAANRFWDEAVDGIAILSGGTDGEDGPTDAAGAWVDAAVIKEARRQNLHPADDLAINNSYDFFARAGGHLKTGPTQTNVMDVRVCLIVP